MEKLIARWSYWLGIASMVIALLWKTVSVFGWWLPSGISRLTYLSFLHASILFFLTTVATACYTWLNSTTP